MKSQDLFAREGQLNISEVTREETAGDLWPSEAILI